MTDLSNHPSAPRHNIYHAVHKGLRLGHSRLMSALGSNDFSDEVTTRLLLAQLRAFLQLAEKHLHSEETEIHTAIELRSPGATSHAHEGHESHEAAFAEIETLIRSVEDAGSAAAQQHGDALYRRYCSFAAADIEHMHGEETELLPTMHRLFSDDELRGIEGRIVAAIPPALMMGFLRLIIPAINHQERLAMLAGLKADVPPEVFSAILNDAVKPSLGADEYRALVAPLSLKAAA